MIWLCSAAGKSCSQIHRIQVTRFEYNHRWVMSRNFLRDAFELLLPLGYELGKLTPGEWSSTLAGILIWRPS